MPPTNPSSSKQLTTHLLSLTPSALTQATTHPFLSLAATASLPTQKLQTWLAQDRLYALSYINFIGSLLSSIRIPAHAKREESLEWRIADVLIDALENIRREVRLFEDVAEGEGWKMEVLCGKDGEGNEEVEVECQRATRCYKDLFAGCVSGGKPVIVGLVVLWATEECYLRSWRFAKEVMKKEKEGGKVEGEGDVMQRVLIPNWTSGEFEGFVRRLEDLVDEWGVEEGGWVWRECEAVWRQVVWVEGEFWPEC
ncbi:hypothetical protein CKM354_000630800 [Cercospora kikuchii]|uniref:Thiaminase-2/PQQC domain-containing protein n=1 Tax=Cercospora kikuchii TaxID=84275 RepID=A0A9P3FD70_9PEZI|nr:uncharacterized protein CKM354_000630800 [Cercospora kikuchii]GIZ43066.1 hypothetical protein CKM354_000630800 [Cercospora kikuchii]